MEEIRKQFSRLIPADKIRPYTVSNQADMVKGKLNAAYTSDKTGLFLDKVILYKEIAEVLAEKGFIPKEDIKTFRNILGKFQRGKTRRSPGNLRKQKSMFLHALLVCKNSVVISKYP